MRLIGTTAFGVRLPIVREGTYLIGDVVQAVCQFPLQERDIIAVTESVVARSQGNYVSIDDIKAEVIEEFGPDATVHVVFPIFSRNRFGTILKGIARGAKKVVMHLGSPTDEVGNVLTNHPFTGMNYLEFYRKLVEEAGAEFEFYTWDKAPIIGGANIIVAGIHNREELVRHFQSYQGNMIFTLADFCNKPNNQHGYNIQFGLYGSNVASETTLKLFPRDTQPFVEEIQRQILTKLGKHVEVMVYGDGAFKDPVGKIWELADPVVSPGYTSGLEGTPSEIKMKYVLDTELKLGNEADLRQYITSKEGDMVGKDKSLGTTPRRYTDLIGSLCDLISGSGDKGTPVVVVQGYFDNYASN